MCLCNFVKVNHKQYVTTTYLPILIDPCCFQRTQKLSCCVHVGGNSYNQLAVLATYSGDDLAAVYFYFRSLAVAKPFTIARENLVLLLEQIRVKFTKLPEPPQPKGPSQHVPMKNKRPVNVLMQEMSVRLAHLYGGLQTATRMLAMCQQQAYHLYNCWTSG